MKWVKLNINQRYVDHAIQAILIFASVFFAFWLTDVREVNAKKNTLNISLEYIASEMQYNHKRIESVYEYHLQILGEIDSIKQTNNPDWGKLYGYMLKGWKGLQITMLRSTAYNSFLNSNISDVVEYDLQMDLASIYVVQSLIEKSENAMFDFIISDIGFTSLNKIRHISQLYVDILPDVLKSYQIKGKKWLKSYGYDAEVKSESLKKEIGKREIPE